MIQVLTAFPFHNVFVIGEKFMENSGASLLVTNTDRGPNL